ncbi:MAG: aldehyde dehydrogenase, partial [Pseudonocardiales bacterium]|nr:aldehyde dehydrogenase [Pseudonocardiales bacterium]
MTEIQRETALYINGRWVPGGGSDLEVVDPVTEEVTGVITQASTDDVEAAVAAARAAFPGWAATPVAER